MVGIVPDAGVLLLAASLDYIIGDPWNWPHPVRIMGWAIAHFTHFALKQWSNPLILRLAGILLGIGLVTGSGIVGWLIVQGFHLLHPLIGVAVESILLASCFAGRSLRAAAEDVLQPLEKGRSPLAPRCGRSPPSPPSAEDPPQPPLKRGESDRGGSAGGSTQGDIIDARVRLSQYVGRDTENLSEPEILRAILETVTENATDGVMAPLFYAIAGAFLPVVGCVPLAIAYKAASTLDSMVGYREAPYTDIGWFSARLEDNLTWLPCRLTVITLALLGGKPQQVWRICRRDAIVDPSPNSGWSECAYAAILGVQMGGTNWYGGVAKHKPLLGDFIQPITPAIIHQALRLTRYCFLFWLGLACFVLILLFVQR